MTEESSQLPAAPIVCAHTGFGIVEVRGSDASAFLHGQLSSDVLALEPGHAQYACYNSPKGRMLANLIVLRPPASESAPEFLLLLAADLAATICKRLSMFVLRSRVSLRDAGDDYALVGLAGPGAGDAARAAFAAAPGPFEVLPIAHGAVILAVPDGRMIAVCPRAEAALLHAAIVRHAARADCDAWHRSDIDAGVPWISAATSDQFIPQAANWELLGGVNFQKGCYPGQEIIARTQYLGRLKERLFSLCADAGDAIPGRKLHSATFGDQACGTVVTAAPRPGGGVMLLAVAQIAAVEAADIALANDVQATLTLRPLPYAVPPPAAAGDRVKLAG
jgi:hypothetical protein